MENLFTATTTLPMILIGWGAIMGLIHRRSVR